MLDRELRQSSGNDWLATGIGPRWDLKDKEQPIVMG